MAVPDVSSSLVLALQDFLIGRLEGHWLKSYPSSCSGYECSCAVAQFCSTFISRHSRHRDYNDRRKRY